MHRALTAVFAAFLPGLLLAAPGPFISSQESQLRSDIERLVRAQLVNLPLTSWPLSRTVLHNQLLHIAAEEIPASLLGSVSRLRAAVASDRSPPTQSSLTMAVRNQPSLLRQYGASAREQRQAQLQISGGFAGDGYYQLSATAVDDPFDGDNSRWDGSHVSYPLGDWWLSAGAIERWWGPGWASSLILSNNARPVPGVSLQRAISEPSSLPLLHYLGPWSASAFVGQMDDDRAINQAKLVGLAVNFKPHPRLEIGLRRTAQWGGDGRPQSANNFFKLLTGRGDNCYDSECREDEPGNQLGGIDLRLDLPKVTLYAQLIGEDEANGWPAKNARQLGASGAIGFAALQGSWFVEQSDSRCASSKRSGYNCFYNHSIYQTGYRYQGRAIGASWDNDAKVTSLGLLLDIGEANHLRVTAHHGELNRDSLATGAASLHSVTQQGAKLRLLALAWRRQIGWGEWTLEADYSRSQFADNGLQEHHLGLAAEFTYRW